jgi:crossover junction endodeoxyribonuclease RuvC
MKLYCGIDPGAVSGAWAVIDHNGKYWSCGDISNVNGRINTLDFKAELVQALDRQDVEFCLESVHAFSGQGVSSTFKFGRAVGAIDAVCEAFRSPVHYVTPQKWKKLLNLDSDKNKSLELARSLWPNAPLSRKKDNNRAEALLLAEYLRREQL